MSGITQSQAFGLASRVGSALLKTSLTEEEVQKLSGRRLGSLSKEAAALFVREIRGEPNFGIPCLDLSDYRAIDGLIVIGPEEIEQAFLGPNGENPLGLKPNWCQEFAVDLPEGWTPENLSRIVELCGTPEWNTTPILWLALPEVAGQPTSLTNQYGWWGVGRDGYDAGTVHQDVQWSNWFIKNQYQWAADPAVTEPTWKIGYELPRWSTSKNWKDQQAAAKERGLEISSVASDSLMMNLVAIATGKWFRASTWARTATLCDGQPLYVYFSGNGLSVYDCWNPEYVDDVLGAALEGVPSELVS